MASESPLRIVFAGTPDFAAHYLKFVLDNTTDQVIGVYTQPDRPAGRGKKLQSSPVKQLAEANRLPVFQPLSLKDSEAQNELRSLKPDLLLVVAYGLILPQAVLDLPTYGCINVHASLLPRWRGAAPIQRAIEAGDKSSGVTIMQMDAGLDTGDMLTIAECDISAVDTAGSLHDKLANVGETALVKALDQIRSGAIKATAQDNNLSNYAPKISKQEARVDWSESAEVIERKIRAFYPFPVAYTHSTKGQIRLHHAYSLDQSATSSQPGTILNADDNGIDVCTGEGVIRIKQLQLPGKKAMNAADILRGNQQLFAPGTQFNPDTPS